jgi:hypothetical protein
LDRSQLQEHLLRRHALRVGDEMADYIARRLRSADGISAIPVIAADARTGIPKALTLAPDDLNLSVEP